jgi:hypothetical protein
LSPFRSRIFAQPGSLATRAAFQPNSGLQENSLLRLLEQDLWEVPLDPPDCAREGAVLGGVPPSTGDDLAWDFFSVEAVVLDRFYVLHFTEVDAPRVYLAGVIPNPVGEWARPLDTDSQRCAPLRCPSDPNQRTDTG